MSISSSSSPRKPAQQDFQAASAAVELEYNAVKRLKRLSIGNSLNFDPDLPSTESYFLDNNQLKKSYDSDLHRSKSILSTHSTSSLGRSFDSYLSDDENDATANDLYHSGDDDEDDDDDDEAARYSDAATAATTNLANLSKLSSSSVHHEDIDFNDDNVDFLDLDPDSSFGDSDIIWVPATAHPKLSPENFRKHVQNTVDGIQTKLERSGSIKSSLNRETSVNDLHKTLKNTEHRIRGHSDDDDEEEEDDDGDDDDNEDDADADDDDPEHDKENLIFSKDKERERGGLQIRKPSLKELTVQLETLSKRAGLDNNDAVTLARTLSTRSIGITKLEKEVYCQNENDDNNDKANNIDQIPTDSIGLNRARSRKLLLRNNLNKTRESLFIKDDLFDGDDDLNNNAEIDDDLIEMDYKSNDGSENHSDNNYNNNSSSDFVSNLKRGRWPNYRRQQNFGTPSNLPNLPTVPQRPRKGNENSRPHPHVHVYKDIQKIHNAQKPLGRPQLEPIKSKTPSSRLPDLPSSANPSSPVPSTTPASAFVSGNLPLKSHNRAYDEMVKSRNNKNIYQQQKQQPNRQVYPQQKRQPYPQQHFEQQQRQQQYPTYKQSLSQTHHHRLQNQNQQLQQQRRNHKYGQMSPNDTQHRLPKAQNVYRNYNGPTQQQSPPILSPTDLQDANRINFLNTSNQTSHSRNRYASDRTTLDAKRQLVDEKNVIADSKQVSPVDGIKHNLVNELDNLKIRNKSKDSVVGSVELEEANKSQAKLDALETNEGNAQDNGKITNKTNEFDTDIDKEKEKEKEKDGNSKAKSSFSSFFKIKRDKPRSASQAAEATEEPKLAFKVKRSLSHSSESGLSSPKTDFKSFFGGKKEKEKEKEQEKEREKEKSESTSSSIMKKAHDGISSSPKLGVGLFSSHSNLLSKNKSSENVSESGGKKEKPESNILGFQHKHKRDTADANNQKGRIAQNNRTPQRKESNVTLKKATEPVELKTNEQNSIADDSNESTLTNSLDEGEKSKLINSAFISNPQNTTSPVATTSPGVNLVTPSDSFSNTTDASIPVVSNDSMISSDLNDDKNVDSGALTGSTPNNSSQVISLPAVGVNENVQEPQTSEPIVSPEAESTELIKRSLEETLQQNERPSKPNQPLEMRDSAFGFPLPPVSNSTLVMIDHRFPVQVERAIYRLSHLKLADPKRPLRQQVLLSNFMYSYLNLVNHTLWIQSKEREGNENELPGTGGRNEMIMNGNAVTASEASGPLM